MEFSREKSLLFDKWCSATKTDDFNSLRELVLLEEFKACLSDRVVVYLNEQKVSSLAQAAVLADEFMLTHKGVFFVTRTEKSMVTSLSLTQDFREKAGMQKSKELRDCFYCHKPGHLIADCLVLMRKQQSKNPKSVALMKTVLPSELSCCTDVCDINYKPFVMPGFVSLSGKEEDRREICILRDTGAMQSIMLSDVLPFSDESYCGSNVLIRGIERQVVSVPLHNVQLCCSLLSGVVRVGIRNSLPVKGITLILGNDLAGGKVLPVPEVTDVPQVCLVGDVASRHPEVFSSCAVTRAQSAKTVGEVDLADSLMGDVLAEREKASETKKVSENVPKVKNSENVLESFASLKLPVTRSQIVMAQNDDSSLKKCLSAVISREAAKKRNTAYFRDNDLLMRKWCSKVEEDLDWNVVVPLKYRSHVLCLAHEHLLSGHLWVTKTYHRILQHFFWPGLKRDVTKFCRTCHTCQIAGKPNQVISPAPLSPIPVIGEAFEEVLIDCVGPLPKTKAEGDANADEDGLIMRNTPQQCTLFSDVPSQTSVLEHDIEIKDAKPIKQHPYRVNEIKRSAMKTETDYLLQNDLARHSSSPWSSPCLLVKKPDGSFRFCTDYRKVNAVTVPDCYPLPRMEDCVDSVGSAKFVSKLELLKGYWQVPLTPRASDISAFVTPDSFLQYQVMAFGLRNAPATFQRLIQTVLAGVPNCRAYLDDLVIFSNDWTEHVFVAHSV